VERRRAYFASRLEPEEGMAEPWNWRYHRGTWNIASLSANVEVSKKARDFQGERLSPWSGLGCDATLNTAFKKPKITPSYLLKISPLIRTATLAEPWNWRYHRSPWNMASLSANVEVSKKAREARRGGAYRPFGRLRQLSHIEHDIW